jgi:ABC-type polysaccharide/polyol phosphate transport system ATPase subunit
MMTQIKLSNVTVEYPIFTSHTRSLKTALFGRLGGTIAKFNDTIIVRALNNLTLELGEGDRLGIVGHNGAGKTTFLRVAAGIYEPQHGHVEIQGSISSLPDFTLGMDLEATGWDNIIFRCVFMGLTFAEARERSPSIADFSELGDFLDMPVRTYSTGMFLRLAFAISTSIYPDILIMDEMISAGDAQFMIKANERLTDLIGKTKILIIASHNTNVITMLCNKVLWLEHGNVKMFGPVNEVISEFSASFA